MNACVSVIVAAMMALATEIPVSAQEEPLSSEHGPPNAIWLDSLDLSRMSAGWGEPQRGLSCEKRPITLKGVV